MLRTDSIATRLTFEIQRVTKAGAVQQNPLIEVKAKLSPYTTFSYTTFSLFLLVSAYLLK